MDSITHIVIGACLGEAFLGNKLGKKSMIIGAVAHSFPDIDFATAFVLKAPASLLAHRGFTHSIFFSAVMTGILAVIAKRLYARGNISLQGWLLFFSAAIFGHIFIDAFNNYGTGWFEPFSHYRVSFNTLYVADPFFSIGPVIASLVLLITGPGYHKRRLWWKTGIYAAIVYLVCSIVIKFKIDADARNILAQQHISYDRYFTTPAPFNNCLWYVVAENDQGYYTGYRSVFDRKKEISFQYFSRNDSLLADLKTGQEVRQLIRFSKQFYTVEKQEGALVFNDLRFGEIFGWENPRGKFVFHYILQQPGSNTLVVQRGRFSNWNLRAIQLLIRRIEGN